MRIIGVILLTGMVIGGVIAGAWAFRYFTADVRGRIDAQEIRKAGPLRVAAYNHFFNLCASVQGLEASLEAQEAQLAVTESGKDRERVRSNIAGLTAERERSIRQYNADARKDYTIGQFRDSDLPYQLPTSHYEGGRTSCGA